MLMQTREFVVNIPTEDQAWEVDWCGVKSGRDHDKFAECNFTAISAAKVRVPLIAECPVNLECRVARLIDDLSTSHVIFIGEIVSVDIDKEFYDFTDSGSTLASRIKPLVYCNGNYYKLGKLIGRPGFSVRRR